MNCFGTFTFATGSKYVGRWRDGKEHGQRTYTLLIKAYLREFLKTARSNRNCSSTRIVKKDQIRDGLVRLSQRIETKH